MIKHQHLTFSVAVCLFLARILRQVQLWSVAMVRRYDVISRCSSHFRVKIDVFLSITFNNKSKSRKVFIYVLFFMKSTHTKKIPLTAAVVLRSITFKNRFEILQHIKNSGEKFHPPSTIRFPLLKCTTVGGMNLCVRPRVDMFLKSNSLSGTHAPYSLLNSSQKVPWENGLKKWNTALETIEDFFCQPNFNDSQF